MAIYHLVLAILSTAMITPHMYMSGCNKDITHMQDIEKTITALLEALQFSPNNIRLKKHVAELLLQVGRNDEAIQHWEEIYQRTEDPECKGNLGKAYYNRGDFQKAR